MQAKRPTSLKIMVCGPGGVGKSALTIRFSQDHFITDYDPTIENMYRKQVSIDEQPRVLEILDQAGREEYSAMHSRYIESSDAIIVVFSITDSPSLNEAKVWLDRICERFDTKRLSHTVRIDSLSSILVGNKVDLAETQRNVNVEEAENLANSYGVRYMETSAKTRHNVDDLFITASHLADEAKETAARQAAPDPAKKVKKSSRCQIL